MDKMFNSIIELSLTPTKRIEMNFELVKLNKFIKDSKNSKSGKVYKGSESSFSMRCMILTPRGHSALPSQYSPELHQALL